MQAKWQAAEQDNQKHIKQIEETIIGKQKELKAQIEEKVDGLKSTLSSLEKVKIEIDFEPMQNSITAIS